MLTEKIIVQKLSKAGYRVTRPRRAVMQALLEDESFSSAAELLERARVHHPSTGLVTVYRTLDLLSQMGFVRRIHTEDGCHSYARATTGHRHHLVCRQCGAAVEFEGCDLSPFFARLAQETGYSIEDHLLELVGLCSGCR